MSLFTKQKLQIRPRSRMERLAFIQSKLERPELAAIAIEAE